MTIDNLLEELRVGSLPEEEISRKRLHIHRAKDADQHSDKLRERIRMMETVYQERFEEMRTALLGITRERDAQAERLSELETQLTDMPIHLEEYLNDQNLIAVPKEKYEQLQNIDMMEFSRLDELKEKCQSLEGQNKELSGELEKNRSINRETVETSIELEEISIQMQEQSQQIEQQKAQLKVQMEQLEEKQAELKSRDVQAERLSELETQLADMPKYLEKYLKDQNLAAVPKEKYEQLQNVDIMEYGSLDELKAKCQLLESQNRELLGELEKNRATSGEAVDAARKLEKIYVQMQEQSQQIELQKARQQLQIERVEEKQAELNSMKSLTQSLAAQLAQLQSKKQTLELQNRLSLELNQLLSREKECIKQEALRQKEIWNFERGYLIQRFNEMLNSQKQYMNYFKDGIGTSITHIEKLSIEEILSLAAAKGIQDI